MTTDERRTDWWALALPASYLAHLAEEWWGGGGFAAWTARIVGAPVSETRFLVVNAIAAPVFVLGTVMALTKRSWTWFIATFATIVLVNGLLHLLGSVATVSYSPGAITGTALYLPLGVFALRRVQPRLSEKSLGTAVAFGLAIHAAVAIVAFWR